MFKHLAICHNIVTTRDPKDESKFIFNSSSPDELALVNGAKFYGVRFVERNERNEVVLSFDGGRESEKFKFLNIVEFTSQRKRMTVVVRDQQGKILVMTKGADSALVPLLK